MDNFNLEFANNIPIWNVPWKNSNNLFKIVCLEFKHLDPTRDQTVRLSVVFESEKHKSFLKKSYNMCSFRKISKYKLFETIRTIFAVLLYQYQFELKCRLLMLPHFYCPLIF